MKFDFRLFQNSNNKQKKIINLLIAIFCIGLLITLLFDETVNKEATEQSVNSNIGNVDEGYISSNYGEEIEKRLEREFSKIEGVGQVEVMVTMKNKGEIVLNKDMPFNTSSTVEKDDTGGTRESNEVQQQQVTVFIKNSDGSEEPLIVKELLPEVNGILIIAEGGDNPIVKNDLINASKVLLDLPAHKIEVMKRVPN